MEKVVFQVALGAVKHFGKNLYTSNPPAIAELIANSWDAYAKKCQIVINNNSMYIIDDGVGMTDAELSERYGKSGFEKDEKVRKPKNMLTRPLMGKKGIGKFSAFSLSDSYSLITKSEDDKNWKQITLNYNELYSDRTEYEARIINLESPSSVLIQTLFPFDLPKNTGTIIVLSNLKRRISNSTKKCLKELLAKRFSSSYFDGKYEFELFLNFGEITQVSLREHFFYTKVEYIYYFNKRLDEMQHMFPNVEKKNLIDKTNDYFTTHASGWIGTVGKPTDLKTEDETSVSGVSIYIHGKIADENIFKHQTDGRVPNAYLIGEVDVISLDTDEDPILSSREGLNHEIDGVKSLKNELSKIRNDLLENWNRMRSDRPIEKQPYLEKIVANPFYKKTYENYNSQEKQSFQRLAQKVFDRPSENTEEEIKVLTPAIMQIVNDRTLNSAFVESGISGDKFLSIFAKLFNIAEVNHALRIRSNVANRLNIIRELEKHLENDEVEKVFEKHLASNPWLLNPSLDAKGVKVSTQDKWKYLNIDNSEKSLRTDIIVETYQYDFPIIVEIKRSKKTSYSCPNEHEILSQISKYRKAISAEYGKRNNIKVPILAIKAIFICGKKEYDLLDSAARELLEITQIEVFTYEDLLAQAKSTYSVFNFSEEL